MLLHSLDLATLLVSGLMVGNEFCVAAFIYPVLQGIGAHTEAVAMPAFARRLGSIMPFWYALTLLLTAALVWLHWHSPARPWLIAAATAWAAVIACTILFLVPLNNRIAAAPQNLTSPNLRATQNTWETLHRIRVAALVVALLCLLQGVLLGTSNASA